MGLRGCGVIVAAFFTVSIAYAIRYGYGMLLPGMLPALGITKTEAGVIYACYFATYTVCSPLLGILSDRIDSRLLLTCFSMLLAVGALLMARATTVVGASAAFSLAGLGHAACWAPVMSLVQQWVDDRNRGVALAFTTMGSGIGVAVWSMLLPGIVSRSGWESGWLYMGLFALLVALINYMLVRDPPLSADSGRADRMVLRRHRGVVSMDSDSAVCLYLLTTLRLWLVGCSYMLIGFTVLVPFTFLGVYISGELRLSYATAAGYYTLIALAGIVGKLLLGILSDRWNRVGVMMICGLLLAIGCSGIAHFSDLWLKICCTVLLGLGFGAVWPVYAAAAVDFFPKSVSGAVIGIWTFFLGIGSIVSPIVCGWSVDRSGSYVWAFDFGCGAAILSAILLIPLFAKWHIVKI